MNTFYYIGKNPTVDLIIVRETQEGPEFLMIQRELQGVEVESGKWALPGGFHDSNGKKGETWKEGKETAKEAAIRELVEETLLDIKQLVDDKIIFLEEVGTYEGNNRDPRDNDISWTSSSAFIAILPNNMDLSQMRKTVETEGYQWFKFDNLPENVAFDHRKIIQDGYEAYKNLKNQKNKSFKM